MHRLMQFWTFHPIRTYVVLMIARLDQKTQNAKCKIYINFKSMNYMNLLWLCSILMAPVVCGFNPWNINTFVTLQKYQQKNKGLLSPLHQHTMSTIWMYVNTNGSLNAFDRLWRTLYEVNYHNNVSIWLMVNIYYYRYTAFPICSLDIYVSVLMAHKYNNSLNGCFIEGH